jgi:hypothetical protein
VIDDPPPSWETTYPQIAQGLTATPSDLETAMTTLRTFWTTALADTPDTGA